MWVCTQYKHSMTQMCYVGCRSYLNKFCHIFFLHLFYITDQIELNSFVCVLLFKQLKMPDKIQEKIQNYRTAPFDARFPNTNQTRNCYQNYLGEQDNQLSTLQKNSSCYLLFYIYLISDVRFMSLLSFKVRNEIGKIKSAEGSEKLQL